MHSIKNYIQKQQGKIYILNDCLGQDSHYLKHSLGSLLTLEAVNITIAQWHI